MPNYYRDALEALGYVGTVKAARNKFNTIAAQADDPQLRELAAEIINLIDRGDVSPKHEPIGDTDRIRNIRSVRKMKRYCESKAYAD
jgi:hypothetical protein